MEKIDIISEVRKRKDSLLSEIDNLEQIKDDNERKRAFDELSQKVDDLKLYVNQNIPGKISYEISTCNSMIKELDQRLTKERDSKRTSFKFSFNLKDKLSAKKKPAPVSSDNSSSSSTTTTTATTNQADSVDSVPIRGLKNLKNETRIMESAEVDQQDLVFDSLENCQIYIHGSPQSIRLVKLEKCKLFSGPVSTSVFIIDCHQCEFQIIAQQIRIHDSTQCDVFQHINSRSIIENCRQFRFGPYSYAYNDLSPDFEKSTIDPKINNWKMIDDFDCLTNPSPNWSLIE